VNTTGWCVTRRSAGRRRRRAITAGVASSAMRADRTGASGSPSRIPTLSQSAQWANGKRLIERPQHVVHRDRGAAAHTGTLTRSINKNAPIAGAFLAVSIAGPVTQGPMATSILVGPPGLEPGTDRL